MEEAFLFPDPKLLSLCEEAPEPPPPELLKLPSESAVDGVAIPPCVEFEGVAVSSPPVPTCTCNVKFSVQTHPPESVACTCSLIVAP